MKGVENLTFKFQQKCKLCEGADETLGHLFFHCPVAADIWGQLLKCQGIIRPSWDWPTERVWMERHCGANGAHSIIYRMTLAGCIYQVWQERNQVIFQGKKRTLSTIVRLIIQDVYYCASKKPKLARVLSMLNFYPC
ncbi:hypothetical protein KY285_031401 [Solanum tuberosum]|nr:hypothetical protein KY284_031192 [Solanum tuberosum]KAH0656519.1 hypothetical protein KY285_031401 [Solanum tuberosum]